MLVKKILYATKIIETEYFNILTKISFNVRMIEASTNLSTKNQVETAHNLGDRNRKKSKIQMFDISYFISECYFNNYG